MYRRLAYTLGCAVALGSVGTLAATVDLPGSADPDGFERFPRSWIVNYVARPEPLPYDFVITAVGKSRRDVRIDNVIRVVGPLTRVTYQSPPGTRLEEVTSHYRSIISAIGARTAFTCTGADCGRSSVWAHDIFGVAVLAAPNRSQFYLAAPITVDDRDLLAAIYVVQRGNQRVYAHIDIVEPAEPVQFARNQSVAQTLAREGIAIIEQVRPDGRGVIDAAGLATLAAVAQQLSQFRGQTVYVVCHLYGSSAADDLIEWSNQCAATAATTIREVSEVEMVPFGAGPLLPRGSSPRIELIIPHRLRRE